MKEIINFDSDEAAQQVTVTLWKSKNGSLYSDEGAARYSGCTHRPCSGCGEPAEKMYTHCAACRGKLEQERYDALPMAPYTGDPVYSQSCQEYFFDVDDIESHLDTEECTLEDLMLVHCDHEHLRDFDYDDYYSDKLPEDRCLADVWPELAALFDAANQLIFKEKNTISWFPNKVRVDVSTIKIEERPEA